MSPGPPVWAILTFRLGSACTIFSTMLSGGGMGPKSLLLAFAFQVPLKSDFAWAWTSPRARVKSAKEKILNVDLRIRILLLFLEYLLHVGLAHGAGDVPRDRQSLSIAGKSPAVFGGKIVPAEGPLSVNRQLVAVPFQRAFELVVGHVIHAFLAVRGVADVVGHVALHTPGGGDVRLQAGILVRDLFGNAVGRRHLAEIALARVQLPGTAEVSFGLGLDQSKSQSQKRQRKESGSLPDRKAAHENTPLGDGSREMAGRAWMTGVLRGAPTPRVTPPWGPDRKSV